MGVILAIDPGNEMSAFVRFDEASDLPLEWDKVPNRELLHLIDGADCERMAVEMIASYGMPVGRTTFDTCVWIGRFIERWRLADDTEAQLVYRHEVKSYLCGSQRAKDSNVRQALLDRYGPGKELAVGRKAAPGVLYGMHGDCWSALAVAVTAVDLLHRPEQLTLAA